jgi:LPS O-antigen subunit length determinant protein (WzzB/FepE family)
MVTLELSAEDAEMLQHVLENYVSDLRMEIADTDLKDFRDKLKAREAFLKGVIERLGAAES